MDTPIVELPCGFYEGVERCRWPQEYAFQPDGERFDGLGRSAGLSVDFDDVGSVAWTVIFGEAGHSALLQLLDPFDFPLQAIANVDGKTRVLGVKDIPFGATLESVGVRLNEVFKPIDPTVELSHLGRVVVFSLLNCFEQRLGDTLQSVGVEVSATIEDVSGRTG